MLSNLGTVGMAAEDCPWLGGSTASLESMLDPGGGAGELCRSRGVTRVGYPSKFELPQVLHHRSGEGRWPTVPPRGGDFEL